MARRPPADQREMCPICGLSVYRIEDKHYDLLNREKVQLIGNIARGHSDFYANVSDWRALNDISVMVEHSCAHARPEQIRRHHAVVDELIRVLGEKYAASHHISEAAEVKAVSDESYRVNASLQQLLWKRMQVLEANSLNYRCPRCHAAPGQPCENLQLRKSKQVSYNKHPHEQRLPVDLVEPEDIIAEISDYDEQIARLQEKNEALQKVWAVLQSEEDQRAEYDEFVAELREVLELYPNPGKREKK